MIYVASAIGTLLSFVLIRPLKIVALFLFRHVFIHVYRFYRVVKNWAVKIFAPAKNKILYPLLNKSTIHVVIAVLAVAVIANNIAIKETRAEEFGQKTILGTMVTGFDEIDITETAIDAPLTNETYARLTGIVSVHDARPSAGYGSGDDQGFTLTGGGALVNPGLASTAIGERPRDNVLYYIVEGGDTVGSIAEQFGISANTILWENELGVRDYIKPGDKLTILPQSGVSHQIKSGDTIAKIAKEYEVEESDILEYNKLADAAAIEVDQILIIPGGTITPPAPTVQPSTTSSYASYSIPPSSASTGGGALGWPTSGRRISQYSRYGHIALDITGNYSSPVYASDAGRVEIAGYAGRGYGLQVLINHGNGVKTRYAHESKVFVSVGDYVERGQTIGMIGCTGWCTGPHVHYEVIINGRQVNPLTQL